jgi:quinol-cytochrome oxidoreductase complex cytochrome b subunit
MTPKNWITIAELITGAIWITAMLVIWRKNKSKPKMWSRIFGAGVTVYMLVLTLIGIIRPTRPISQLLDYTISNFFWSLFMGGIAYFGGHMVARRFEKKD